jgi:hypothetical protein
MDFGSAQANGEAASGIGATVQVVISVPIIVVVIATILAIFLVRAWFAAQERRYRERQIARAAEKSVRQALRKPTLLDRWRKSRGAPTIGE